jgi:hypothetical protein
MTRLRLYNIHFSHVLSHKFFSARFTTYKIYHQQWILPICLATSWKWWIIKTDKARICICVSALCWSLWTCRNYIVFDNQKGTNILEVIRRAVEKKNPRMCPPGRRWELRIYRSQDPPFIGPHAAVASGLHRGTGWASRWTVVWGWSPVMPQKVATFND